MTIKRGDVYFVARAYATGSEQWGGRPGVVVSNDQANAHSRTVEVVYMTTQPKADLPTHVTISSTERESTALCEQITSVSVDRLGRFLCSVTEEEMRSLETAMAVSLGLRTERPKAHLTDEEMERVCTQQELEEKTDRLSRALVAERAKTETYRQAYEALLDRILQKEETAC